jgi:hypothetical protein
MTYPDGGCRAYSTWKHHIDKENAQIVSISPTPVDDSYRKSNNFNDPAQRILAVC